MANFADFFHGPTLDAAKWSEQLGAGTPSVAIVNGQLICTADIGGDAESEAGVVAANLLNLATREAWGVEVVSTSDPVNGEIVIALVIDGTANRIRYYIVGGNLTANCSVDGVGDIVDTSVAYSATAHRWLRFRHDAAADDIVWEAGPNGLAWAEIARTDRAFAITALTLSFRIASETAGAKVATFDNAGPLPSRSLGLTGVGA